MKYEMFIPIYGNYLTIEELSSEESQDRPFALQAADAIAGGIVSGAAFGFMFNMIPSHGSVLAGKAMLQVATSPLVIPAVLAAANYVVIESAPQAEQRGLWQMFTSGLTGTFGIGSGLNL